ncbi:Tn3 family transposase [Streptomyces sp. NPDC056517]|uniref:Tn3 family transposase n=1 Tax=Streptomyces sp. NPDC056517 TaxID=3345848 RepID=UPI00368D344E
MCELSMWAGPSPGRPRVGVSIAAVTDGGGRWIPPIRIIASREDRRRLPNIPTLLRMVAPWPTPAPPAKRRCALGWAWARWMYTGALRRTSTAAGGAGCPAFQDAARGRVDLARIERHWEDILRIIGSIHTGAVRAYDVIRMLSRDGRPTPLGDAIAHYGRIAKTLHILRLADEPAYRRKIKVQANLQEGRHALARKIFHGKAGQLYQRYQDGMEDQIGALGLVLNALVLFTRYMDAAITQLRADGFDVRDEDVARLSPFVRHHINMLGRYSFQLPELPGGLRSLRDPDAVDEE